MATASPQAHPLTETVALITGANKGIGYEVARLLGERGATVLIGARDLQRGRAAERSLRGSGVDAHHVTLDVTDEELIAQVVKRIEDDQGRLDILVNNAGITGGPGSGLPSQTPLSIMRNVYETNVFGVVAVTNAVLPLLRQAPAARIVNVSSEVGSIQATLRREGPMRPMASIPYPSSKTALNMVTAMYAKELWNTPIKVNAANPGYCATDLNDHSGFRTAEQGAEAIVHLATLPDDGPTASFYGHLWVAKPEPHDSEYGTLPW